jgi:hypothetical protein
MIAKVRMIMSQESPAPDTRRTFLRVVGVLWAVLVVSILVSAALAPHMGRITDFFLHQTMYRRWIRMTLTVNQPVSDASTPVATVQSYYSALYQGDASRLGRLTQGDFGAQVQQRLRSAEGGRTRDTVAYQSYLWTARQAEQGAIVHEKMHLFWRRGLRFHLQRLGTDWAIVTVDVMP